MKNFTTTVVALVLLLCAAVPALPTSIGTGTIIDSAFTVGAGKFVAYPFDVHPRGGRVFGKFKAEGGSGNDIECFIVDEDGLVNFSNRHDTPVFYTSGRVTVATVNVVLGEGRYYIVFNNRFSSFTPKAVEAHVYIKLPNEQ